MVSNTLLNKLERFRKQLVKKEERPTHEEILFYNDRIGGFATVMYFPHIENYDKMLLRLKKTDVICDMGAGDLRFDLMAVDVCKKVYAVELNPVILANAIKIIGYEMPRNLIPVCCDWRYFNIPDEVTAVTCLVNIYSKDLPLKTWKENNRRVYHGVVADGVWDGYDDDGIKEF